MSRQKIMPQYQIIENDILNHIKSGKLKIGEKLMPEKELCKLYGTSRMTVNKALQLLAAKGYIKRIVGSGSFISMPTVATRASTVRSFSNDMRSKGLVPGSKLIDYKIIRGKDNVRVMEKLNLDETDMIHYFQRLRTGNDSPIAISNTFVPVSMMNALDIYSLESSFYEYVEKTLGFVPSVKNYNFEACAPTKEQLELLSIEEGCLLKVSSTALAPSSEPFDYRETFYIASLYTYSIEFD